MNTRLVIVVPVLCFALPLLTRAAPVEKKPTLQVETFRGQVVSLTERLKNHKIDVDPDVGPQLGLETEDGKVIPLVQDGGSVMFYRDKRLLNRPLQVQARLIPDTGLLQILEFFSVKDGKRHEVYYWCEVCAIRRASLEKTGVCECCGGKMELREVVKP